MAGQRIGETEIAARVIARFPQQVAQPICRAASILLPPICKQDEPQRSPPRGARLPAPPAFARFCTGSGGVAERSKAHAWKVCRR